ncbi:MAG: SH3 domain-containing protein [Caldilineaceae bacterium]
MNQSLFKHLRQYWLVLVIALLGGLSIYTSSPSYGAPLATPTPDVQTVPKPELLFTPTNTPFPTPTPDSGDTGPVGGGPVATRQPSDDEDTEEPTETNNSGDTGNNSNSGAGNEAGAGAPTTGTATTVSATVGITGTGPTGVVNAVTLNVRKGPSSTDHIVDTLFMHDQVTVLGRNGAGDWWYICCGSGAQRPGWVSVRFLTPNFAADQATDLLPLLTNSATPTTPAVNTTGATTESEPAPADDTADGANPAAEASPGSLLLVEMRPVPAFALPGETVQLQITIHNRGTAALTDLRLRDDLPDELAFVAATVSDQGVYRYTGPKERGPLLTMEWPTVPANTTVTATVTVRIDAATPHGALLDNLAAVTATGSEEALAGITLAMPPTLLPQFR